MAGRLEGKVALVTGGARGIGEAIARSFAAEGAKVAICDVLADEGEVLAKEISESGTASFFMLDVTDEANWDRTVAEVTSAFGGLDVLVNNAGTTSLSPMITTTLEDYMRVINVNQVGVFLGMRAAAGAMMDAGGSIVNVSSIDGLQGTPLMCAYSASKFAVRGMTKVAALELAGAGIRVNSLHPGAVRTRMATDLIPGMDLGKLMSSSIPAGHVAEPAEIAGAALFLASSDSAYCTGSELVVDGGLTAGVVFDIASAFGS